jgi:steroid delta-isomerase-like uncharacterized protein
MSEENKAIIRRFGEEVLNNKDLDATDEIVAEDFVELDPFPGQEQGREGLKQVLRMLFAAFPDQHWTLEEQIAEGEKVASRVTWRGTHLGEYLGIPPTGRRVDVKAVVIDRIISGKMVESRMLSDVFGLMQQLGVIPNSQQTEAS